MNKTENQFKVEFNNLINNWYMIWFQERKKYPTKILVNTEEPIEVGDILRVEVEPGPDSNWWDNNEPLDIFNKKMTDEYVKKLTKIIECIGKKFKESIAYFTQVQIWHGDFYKAKDYYEYTLKQKYNELYPSFSPKPWHPIIYKRYSSLLLYPKWCNSYESKISTNYPVSYTVSEFMGKFFRSTVLDPWDIYDKEFREYEKRVGIKTRDLNYHLIPPKEIPIEKERIQRVRKSTLIKISAIKKTIEIIKDYYDKDTIHKLNSKVLYNRSDIQAILKDGPYGSIQLDTYREWLRVEKINPKGRGRPLNKK